jgi:hypothetical protein
MSSLLLLDVLRLRLSMRFFYVDKAIDAHGLGCEMKLRPDILFDKVTHLVIVEVDEHQHKDRVEWCECSRMVNLFEISDPPTVFLRYNPHAFFSGSGSSVRTDDCCVGTYSLLSRWPGSSVVVVAGDGSSDHRDSASPSSSSLALFRGRSCEYAGRGVWATE